MKFKTTRPIHGLLGKGTVCASGDIVELPPNHPDIPDFTELGYLVKTTDSAVGADGNPPAGEESPIPMTAEGTPTKAVKTKAKK